MQAEEAERVPHKTDAKRHTPTHIIIKMPKVKDKERGWASGKMGEEVRD